MLDTEWRKSSLSNLDGSCVEARLAGEMIQVRDSKDPDGPNLSFSAAEWSAFCAGVARAEFAI